MILCIGLAVDNTFCHTLSALKLAGVSFDVIDFGQLVYSGHISYPLDDISSTVISLHGETYQISSYESVLIRLVDIAEGAPNEGLKAKSAGFYQALNRLFCNVPIAVMNAPLRDCSNSSKLYHSVALSAVAGWYMPRSCLTNNPEQAIEFIASCPAGVIFKGASAVKTWATLYDPKLHASRMKLLASCPVLFQERISGPDVRVHVVGEQVFAEIIEASNVDYRTASKNTYQGIELPQHIALGCLKLALDCETPLLGIDFKIERETGTWFFLEANSLPCYEGYDRRAGGTISQAIVGWLTGSGRP
jgi:hypothetical protein